MAASALWSLINQLGRTGLGRALRTDAKKGAFLLALALVMAILWGRLILGGTPAIAPASPTPIGVRSAELLDPQPHLSPAMAALREWLRVPVAPLSRNVFAVHPEYFPSDGTQPARAGEEHGFWDDLAKSVKAQADERGKRRQAIDKILLEAGQVKLESTIMGAKPEALVNGKLVKEGDVVALFRVVKIEARGIIVEQKGIKLEIQFNAPAVD